MSLGQPSEARAMQYNFEWDPAKSGGNRAKHGIGFEESATVFRDPGMLTLYDGKHSSDEDRWITMGISLTGRLLVVCHTFGEETEDSAVIRIFSSRKATSTESRKYRN